MSVRARLQYVCVSGFRALQRRTEFRAGPIDDAIVVAGPNGCGKTSFLEAVLLSLGRPDLILGGLPAAGGDQHWRGALPPGASIQLELRVESAPGTLLATRTPCTLAVDRRIDRWEITVDKDAPISDPERVREHLSIVNIEYFASWRAPALLGGVLPSDPVGEGTNRLGANRLRWLKQRIITERARSAFSGASRDESWLERIREVWRALRNDDGTYIDPQLVDPDSDATEFDLFLVTDSDLLDGPLRICAVDHLSSGELEWLTIAGTLIVQQFAGLLVIDEPELHLHPEWQSQVLPLLRVAAPDAQLLVATQADAPWDQAYSFQRVLLVADDDPRGAPDRDEPDSV